MAWSFTNLKYGWRYVVGISLAATTIYVANNTRWRINQADDIELDLAVAERCLATQYGTNAAGEPLYRVVPPEYVRSWYSNSYVTTNVPGDAVTNWTAQLHTNIYTNTVGWRTDRAKAVSRDAKIKALVPYYVDTNSVYDGTTNIIMHTFTGLLTSLDLGDHTNFTAIPAIGTNIATYGPWAWRNYVVAWQERYKVLEALKYCKVDIFSITNTYRSGWSGNLEPIWDDAKTIADENSASPTNTTTTASGNFPVYGGYASESATLGVRYPSGARAYKFVWLTSRIGVFNICGLNGKIGVWVSTTWSDTNYYDANESPNILPDRFYQWMDENVGSNTNIVMECNVSSDATWCLPPPTNEVTERGFSLVERQALFQPTFLYCTNKYW